MNTVTVNGSITGPRTITLDAPLAEPGGRVTVIVQPELPELSPDMDLSTWLKLLHARRRAEGRQKSVEEIDEIIREMIEARGD